MPARSDSIRHLWVRLPCLPEEVIGLSVVRAGQSVGKVVDMALIDAWHASFLLVRRSTDGRVIRVLPDEVAAIRGEGVELAKHATRVQGV